MGVHGKRTRYLYASQWKWNFFRLMWVNPVNNKKSRRESVYCNLMNDGRKCRARLFPHTYRLLVLLFVLDLRLIRIDHSLTYSLSRKGKVGVPIAASDVPIVDLGFGVGAAFSKSVANYWEFDRLERYIMQPTRSYVPKFC